MRSRGFTLVEVLLAVALLAMGLGIAFAVLRGAVAAVDSARAAAERVDQVRAAQHFLRRQLAAAAPQPWLPEDQDDPAEQRLLLGESGLLRFVAPMPGYLSAGGPYLQTLRPALQEGEQVLLFEQSMLAGTQLVPDTGRPAVLLEGIADVAFSYRGIDESGELSDWQERWPSTTSLPLLVRIEVRFEDERTRWPVLEVELARAGSGSGAQLVPRTTAPRPSVVRPGTRQ